MKRTPPISLRRDQPPWLFAAALATTAPHALQQPWWLTALAAVFFAWAIWLWWLDRRLPGRWLILPLAVAGCVAVAGEYRTIFGREPGVALLVLFMALKLLEMRRQRDATVVVMLGYFLLLTHYFHSQEIPAGLWLLFSLWVVTAAQIRLNADAIAPRENLRLAATLLLQALPLMLVLYLLFPRISGPLWGLPADAHSGRTGLSEQMSPGSIADLVRSGEIAFRVRFDATPPPPPLLYWRGPVLENFDGTTWRRSTRRLANEEIVGLGPAITYETTLEAHNQRWLLALDAPSSLPPDSTLDGRLAALAGKPLESRQRHRFSSFTAYRFNSNEHIATLTDNRRLPASGNPQARALAETWRQADPAPQAIVTAALRHFHDEAFHYTLQPPLLGRNAIDDFLTVSRRGFCEHYAAAFVFLMRAAGVPARVVTGYQGGEMNPHDGYLVVRQSEAHAWAEVWLESQGWVRVDPTAAVAPQRIERGIGEALPAGEPLPLFLQRHGQWLREFRQRWEALNNVWNQYVIGYDISGQRRFLSRLGLDDNDWRRLAGLLAATVGGILAVLLLINLGRRPRQAEEIRLWHRAQRRIGLHCAPQETPLAFAGRVRASLPAVAPDFDEITRLYLLVRYAPNGTDHLAALRTAVKNLNPRRPA